MRPLLVLCALLISVGLAFASGSGPAKAKARPKPGDERPGTLVERGKYLVKVAGCNDCHTPGYAESGGTVPVDTWLVGDRLGWRGPWGTTYAINLRTYMGGLTEQQWVSLARVLRSRPPMPWFALRDMTDQDLRAIYQFARSLPPGGPPAPAFVPPGQEPPPPFVQFPEPPK
jgi:mono/diheme cytochrome c family protein